MACRAPASDERGRWPVVTTTWGDPFEKADLFGNRSYSYGEDHDVAPEAVIARARLLSPKQGLAWFGEAPSEDEVPADEGEVYDSYLEWFEPRGDPTALVLLP